MSSTSVSIPRISAHLLDLGGAPASEDRAGHLVMADVAVGHADELDLVAQLGPPRGRAAGLELAVVGMGPEDDDPQRVGRFFLADLSGGSDHGRGDLRLWSGCRSSPPTLKRAVEISPRSILLKGDCASELGISKEVGATGRNT